MSQFFDDLEAQLRAAARAQTGARRGAADRPRSRWHTVRSGTRAIPVALAAAVTMIVVVIALTVNSKSHPRAATAGSNAAPTSPTAITDSLAGPTSPTATTGSHPGQAGLSSVSLPMTAVGTPLGRLSSQQQNELRYVFAAQATAMKSSECGAAPLPRSSVSDGPPPSTLLSMLGVLRRPATPADALNIPHTSRPLLPGQSTDVYVRYTRRARVKDGISYYLTPVGHIDTPSMFSTPCAAKQKEVLRDQLSRIPAGERSSTLALQARLLPLFVRDGAAPTGPAVCITDLSASLSGGGACETAAQIDKGAPTFSDGSTLIGVVPDGVAGVTLHYPAGHGLPALTVTTDVVGNVYAASIPRLTDENDRFSLDITWRSASGQVIKTISAS